MTIGEMTISYQDVFPGDVFLVKVSKQLVPVTIYCQRLEGGWTGINQKTGRRVHIRSTKALRKRLPALQLLGTL